MMSSFLQTDCTSLRPQAEDKELNLDDARPREVAMQPFPSYQKRQKTTSLILAEVAGFKEIKFVGSLVCNLRMKNAFLIPDPLIHNPLICNPQSPQGKNRKSTAALHYFSKISWPGPAETAHAMELSSLCKTHLGKHAAVLGGTRDNKNQIALVRISEQWAFCEVPGMMLSVFAGLPIDLQNQLICSSLPTP